MRRLPVPAARDVLARSLPMAGTGDAWATGFATIAPAAAETLAALARTLAPHDWLDEGPYRHAVAAIDAAAAKDAVFAADLAGFLAALDRVFPLPFLSLSEGNRVAAVKATEALPVFREVLRLVLVRLYDDPVVWSGCGYDGAAGCADGVPRTDLVDWGLDLGDRP